MKILCVLIIFECIWPQLLVFHSLSIKIVVLPACEYNNAVISTNEVRTILIYEQAITKKIQTHMVDKNLMIQ